MSRGLGRVFRPKVDGKQTAVWWLDYSVGGKRHRESSGFTSKTDAQDLLRRRIGDRKAGKIIGRPDRVVFAEYATGEDDAKKLVGGLRALVERQYRLDGRRSLERLRDALGHLEDDFGADAKALTITADRVDAYAERRLAAGASPATVNYEKAALRRAFRLAVEKGLLATMPVIKTPKVRNARQGFFTEGDFAALLVELRDPLLVHYVRLKRLTGWRDNELRPLLWTYVDRETKEVRVPAAEDKGDKALRFPYGLVPDAEAILDTLWETRNGPYVFQRKGQPLRDYRTAWKNACRRAGLTRTLRDPETGELFQELPRPHDFRRTAARDYRAYMTEQEIMDLCGWKTRSTFERYNIVRPEDVDAGLTRRFNGKVAAKSETPETEPDHVS
jgi:integrase-like protein